MTPENPGSGTRSTPGNGDGAPKPAAGAAGGGVGMPRNLEEFDKGYGGSSGGGPSQEAPRRGFTELTKRVLARWGALPIQGISLLLGLKSVVPPEDAQLLGETTVDLMRFGALGIDEATEARYRWAFAHGAAAAEILLAMVERKIEERRKRDSIKTDAERTP